MADIDDDPEVRAIELFREGNIDEALSVLDAAIAREPCTAGLLIVRAIVRHSQSAWSEALKDVELAQTLVPLPVGAQFVLSDCYAHTGRSDLAMLGYKHLLTLGQLPADIYAGLYAGFRRLGNHRLALTTCRAAVEAEPENHAAYFGMAHCMASLNYPANFIASVIRSAVKLEPRNLVYRTSLAIQLVSMRQLAAAYGELSRVNVEQLAAVTCVCSAHKLLELCLWAEDPQRAECMTAVIERLTRRLDPKL